MTERTFYRAHIAIVSSLVVEVAMNYIDILVTLASFIEVIFFYVYTTPMAVNPMCCGGSLIAKSSQVIYQP